MMNDNCSTLERAKQLHNLLRMSPELSSASPESKIAQSFADFPMCLPLIPEISGLGDDFGVHISKF